MTTSTRHTLPVFFAIGLLASSGRAQGPASLLVNGSFEDGPPVTRFLNLPGGDTSLPGWVVTGEGVDVVSDGYWISSDGSRAIDLDGSILIADTENHCIRRYSPADGKITRVAGKGTRGSSGVGGPALDVEMNQPHGIYVHKSGDLYISDATNRRILKIAKK